jgi:hypothetical protein
MHLIEVAVQAKLWPGTVDYVCCTSAKFILTVSTQAHHPFEWFILFLPVPLRIPQTLVHLVLVHPCGDSRVRGENLQAGDTVESTDDKVRHAERPEEPDEGFDNLDTQLGIVSIEDDASNDICRSVTELSTSTLSQLTMLRLRD